MFNKEIIRSISGSWGRFLAIAGIVALGCGFYAGLRMTGPDMRINGDAFYDGTALYDIRMLSTLGYSDDSVARIGQVEGVEAVMASRSTDVMATLDGEQYAMRVNTLDAQAAQESTCDDGCRVVSGNDGYLNRLVLATGSWPTKEGECVLSADRVMGSPIQIGDTVQVLYGSQDLDGVLDVRTFTVVGTAHSSAYVSSVTLGATSLGTGSIQQFVYVTDGNFAADCPYTEVYAKVAGAQEEFSGSDAYRQKVDEVSGRIEGISDELAHARLDQVKADAQSTLDEKKSEYATQKADAERGLDDAKVQLDDAASTLENSQQQIESGTQQIEDAQAQIDAARTTWQQSSDTWKNASDAWAAKRAALVDQLTTAQTTLAGLQAQRSDALAKLQTAKGQLETLHGQESALQAQIAALGPETPATAQAIATLKQQLAAVQAGITQAESGIEQLNSGIAQIDSGISQTQAGIAQINAGIQQGDAQISSAADRLSAGAAEIDANQAELNEKSIELRDAQTQLEQGRADYASGLASYESNRNEAESKLADAAEAIANAQRDIDGMELPSVYVLDRTKNYGVSSYASDSERIDNIAAVFPFIFFLVAALVALTTMTRMVDEERVLIGTYKALGYGRATITWKYLVYAGLASISGALIGIVVLSQVLPAIIARAYAIIYNVPQQSLPLPIDMRLALLSAGMGIGITLFATWAAVAATLREEPAALMLPRAPKAGKRILLERISPLWRKMTFSWKVTCRNLFRYKKRLFMTMIGIAGCTALLLTGLGLHDAIWDIIDKQYGELVHYNVVVTLKDDATEDDIGSTISYMRDNGDASGMTRTQRENMQVEGTTDKTYSVEVVIPQDPDAFSGLLTMRTRIDHVPVMLDDSAVILTEKLARSMGVTVGDTITLFDQDEIGNPTGSGYALTVTGIIENYVGSQMYLGQGIYRQATGHSLSFGSIYGLCTDDTQKRSTFTEGMHERENVETVTYNDETIDSYRKMLSSVNMIVVVLVTAAAALAFIVLYNLTNININERRREIASLKVLGFTKREVDAYIYREIILLTLFGAALGLVLGVFMEGFVVVTAEVDYVMFGRDIHLMSFVWAFVLTIGFSLLVMLAMRRKLGQIDMVESLKSIE